MANSMINVSAYKFIALDEDRLPTLQQELLDRAKSIGLKGSILLGTEGINLFVSGIRDQVDAYYAFLSDYPAFNDLPFKESPSEHQPFTRMLVRIKQEIVSMGQDEVVPEKSRAPYVSVHQLKEWYDQGRDMVVLDTRNDFEVALGSFDDAIHLDIKKFRDFPEAVKTLGDDIRKKTIVTFCTGGIRCEKAGEYMLQQGFDEVYQLHGGILKYFEEVGSDHYHGECFVFDKRVAVDANLEETKTRQCFACRMPLTAEDQVGLKDCPYCGGDPLTGDKVYKVEN